MPAADESTLQGMPKPESDLARIDLRLEELHKMVFERGLPRNADTFFSLLRVTYIYGYVDGMLDEPPLTEEIPMLRYPQLYLP